MGQRVDEDNPGDMKERISKELQATYDECSSPLAVLRAFGVPVQGGLQPSDAQMLTAFKQAKLLFHPDKHQQCSLEAQFRAEGIFVLIGKAEGVYGAEKRRKVCVLGGASNRRQGRSCLDISYYYPSCICLKCGFGSTLCIRLGIDVI